MSVVDMRSDTVTQPTDGMWDAMRNAQLGDDVLGDDPTVLKLEEMAAERFEKEAAIFTPSGTMANQIAIRLHTQPGDEVLMEAGAHPFNYEGGASALISGVQIRPIPGIDGILNPSEVEQHFRAEDPHYSPVGLVCAEDTANRGGGTVYPLEKLVDVIFAQEEELQRAEVLIGGRRCRVLGVIAMDQMVVDLGPETDCRPGDDVIVFGAGDRGEPTAADWARWSDTIGYEIVTRISPRIPRQYVTLEAD